MPLLGTIGAAAARGFGLFGKLAVAIDQYFSYVTMLLPGNGTNGAQNNTFLDSSTNNFSITRNGNTTQGTFSPYGSNWGNYFTGSGAYLTFADNAALQLGSGDFTVEFWINFSSLSNYQTCFDKGYAGSGALLLQTNTGTGTILVVASGSTVITASSAGTVGSWDHYALVRSGTTLILYRNGVSVGTATNSTNFNSTATLNVGGSAGGGGYYVNGYMSNVRVVKGTAVYTSAFTPSTTPLTAITNTSLLTCQSNRFIDNSTNAFTITKNGDVSVQRFSPFSPTAPYAAGTIGGSGYFDGSGDYLVAPDNSAFAFGTGDFTLEAWFYKTANQEATILSNLVSSSDSNSALTLYATTTNAVYISTWFTYLYQSGSNIVINNQWNHIAFCRSGTTDAVWLNGVRLSSWSDSFNYTVTNGYRVGAYGSGVQPFAGYISNARVIKGVAVYSPSSSTIAVPTAPFTSTANTSLLCSMTNGGIIDNAMMNDLETVGTAQISTAQSKFGGGSIYCPGGSTGWLYSGQISPLNSNLGATYTIEMFIRASNVTSFTTFFRLQVTSTGNTTIRWRVGAGDLFFNSLNSDNATTSQISGGGLSVDTWYHVAVSVNQNSAKMFVNGVQVGSTTTFNPSSLVADQLYIGEFGPAYIDDLRITKGYARYTTNFTPPTQALPLQ